MGQQMGQANGMHIGASVKTIDALTFVDGDVIVEDGVDYLVRIYPDTPHPTYGAQVRIVVSPITDGVLCEPESDVTDDDPAAIHDVVHTLIWTCEMALEAAEAEEFWRERDAMNRDYLRSRI